MNDACTHGTSQGEQNGVPVHFPRLVVISRWPVQGLCEWMWVMLLEHIYKVSVRVHAAGRVSTRLAWLSKRKQMESKCRLLTWQSPHGRF